MYQLLVNVGSDRAMASFYRQVTVVERQLVAAFEREADWRPTKLEDREDRA